MSQKTKIIDQWRHVQESFELYLNRYAIAITRSQLLPPPKSLMIHLEMPRSLKPFKPSVTQVRISNEKPNTSHAT